MREATQLTKVPSAGRRGTTHIDVRDGSRWKTHHVRSWPSFWVRHLDPSTCFHDVKTSETPTVRVWTCPFQAVALLKWATPLELTNLAHGTSSGGAGPAVLRYHEELGLFTMCWSWYLQGGNGNIPIPRDVPESPTAEINSNTLWFEPEAASEACDGLDLGGCRWIFRKWNSSKPSHCGKSIKAPMKMCETLLHCNKRDRSWHLHMKLRVESGSLEAGHLVQKCNWIDGKEGRNLTGFQTVPRLLFVFFNTHWDLVPERHALDNLWLIALQHSLWLKTST